jgi:hypothetical protein
MKVEYRKSSAEADSVSAKSEPQVIRYLGLFLCLQSAGVIYKKARIMSGFFMRKMGSKRNAGRVGG